MENALKKLGLSSKRSVKNFHKILAHGIEIASIKRKAISYPLGHATTLLCLPVKQISD
jgi:hypothetical protein